MIGKAPRLTSIWWIQQSFAQSLEQIWIQGKAWRQSCWKDGRHKWSKAGSYWSYWAFILCWTLARYQTRYIRDMAQKYLLIQVWKVFLYLLLQWLPCLCCGFCCYCYYRYCQILLFLYTVSSTAMAALSVLFLKYYSSNALLFARLQCLLFSSLPTQTVTPFADVSRIGPQGSISCKDNSSV